MTLDSTNPNMSRVSTAKLADSPSLQSEPVIVNHAGHKYEDPGKNDAPMKPEGFRESSAEFKSSNLTEDQKKTADKVIDVAQNTLGPDHSNSVSAQTPALTPKPSVSKKVKEKIIEDRRAALDKPTGDSGVTLLRCYAKASAVNLDRASKIKSVKKEIFEDKKAIIEAKIDLADPKTRDDFKEDILDFIDRSEKRIQANQDLLQGLESNNEETFLTALEGVIRPKIDGVLDLLSKTKISSSKKLELTDDFGETVTAVVSPKNEGKDLDIRITVGVMGEGGFSIVHQAVDLSSDQPVVIKAIAREKLESDEKKNEMESEIRFIKKFKEVDGGQGIEGIVVTHDIVETEDEIFIIQECFIHGDEYNRELNKPEKAGRTFLATMTVI